jgi:hypothetical protein
VSSTPPVATKRPAAASSSPTNLSDSLAAMAHGGTGWLWITTGVSALVFGVGLALTLVGGRGAATTTADAGEAEVAAGDGGAGHGGHTSTPTPPAGMLLVVDATGRPAFFVDRGPVSNKAYAQVNPSWHYAAEAAHDPVVGLPFAAAREYARARGKRLVRDGEWQAALDTLGFVPAGMRFWEWVDDGSADDKADKAVRRVEGGAAKHPAHGDKATTFRLAEDLP